MKRSSNIDSNSTLENLSELSSATDGIPVKFFRVLFQKKRINKVEVYDFCFKENGKILLSSDDDYKWIINSIEKIEINSDLYYVGNALLIKFRSIFDFFEILDTDSSIYSMILDTFLPAKFSKDIYTINFPSRNKLKLEIESRIDENLGFLVDIESNTWSKNPTIINTYLLLNDFLDNIPKTTHVGYEEFLDYLLESPIPIFCDSSADYNIQFILHAKSGIVAMTTNQEQNNEEDLYYSNIFQERFSDLINNKTNFTYGMHVESICDIDNFMEFIQNAHNIVDIAFTLYPSNPNSGFLWKPIDNAIQKLLARKVAIQIYAEEEQNKLGESSKKNIGLRKSFLRSKLFKSIFTMISDGYGNASIHYQDVDNRKYYTSSNQFITKIVTKKEEFSIFDQVFFAKFVKIIERTKAHE